MESNETLLKVIDSLKRDRQLVVAQVSQALAKLEHAQQALTWVAIEKDIEAAKANLNEIRLRVA